MVHLNDDGKRALGTYLAFTILPTVAVGLRFVTRLYIKAQWPPDDLWAILSLIGLFGWMSVEIWSVFEGFAGTSPTKLAEEQQYETLQTYIKSFYALVPLYALTVTATKLSILYLYRRIFAVRIFRRISLVVVVICFVWWIVFTVTSLVPCRPVKSYWDPQVAGQCYNFNQFFLSASIADVLIDAVILALPVKMILGLQLSNRKKVSLCSVFSLGGFVVITGIIRTALTYVPHSNNIDFTKGDIWTNVHLGTGILCANLPIYPPLISYFVEFCSSVTSRFSSHIKSVRASKTKSQSSASTDHKHYDQLRDPKLQNPKFQNQFHRETTAMRTENEGIENEWELNKIVVQNTVNVV